MSALNSFGSGIATRLRHRTSLSSHISVIRLSVRTIQFWIEHNANEYYCRRSVRTASDGVISVVYLRFVYFSTFSLWWTHNFLYRPAHVNLVQDQCSLSIDASDSVRFCVKCCNLSFAHDFPLASSVWWALCVLCVETRRLCTILVWNAQPIQVTYNSIPKIICVNSARMTIHRSSKCWTLNKCYAKLFHLETCTMDFDSLTCGITNGAQIDAK